MTERDPRSPAEWVTLTVSLLVLAALVGIIVVRLLEEREPAAPTATVEGVEEIGGVHHVEVTVRNEGDDTAADVQIVAELVIGDETTEADQVLDFLAGDEEEQVVFVFEDDPADGELTVGVSGFSVP
ncbi:MAG TPA: hypothetical protein VJ804_03845 [Acidimicrobiales bacterium]|nr:hypothetical protein [Acidimicrobiales bacterium]